MSRSKKLLKKQLNGLSGQQPNIAKTQTKKPKKKKSASKEKTTDSNKTKHFNLNYYKSTVSNSQSQELFNQPMCLRALDPVYCIPRTTSNHSKNAQQQPARHCFSSSTVRQQHRLYAANSGQPETFMEVMSNIFSALNVGDANTQPTGANVLVSSLNYQPPGAPSQLLTNINLNLPPNKLGLVFGRSGSGKTTLLQLIAGLAQPTSGHISFNGLSVASQAEDQSSAATGLSMQQRMVSAGLVFQFPERHFVGTTLADELTVGWPTTPQGMVLRQQLTTRAFQVLAAVGLDSLPLDIPLKNLSDGYKRRVALAVQLVRRPSLLLLDEPLAGLDWKTRAELIRLLSTLKDECTMLVVSHDLKELAPLVDKSWRMQPGGKLSEEKLPI